MLQRTRACSGPQHASPRTQHHAHSACERAEPAAAGTTSSGPPPAPSPSEQPGQPRAGSTPGCASRPRPGSFYALFHVAPSVFRRGHRTGRCGRRLTHFHTNLVLSASLTYKGTFLGDPSQRPENEEVGSVPGLTHTCAFQELGRGGRVTGVPCHSVIAAFACVSVQQTR